MRIILNDHIPVLATESIDALAINPDGTYIDATFGRGGHTRLILEQLDKGTLLAFDQDIDAIAYGKEHCQYENLILIHDTFSNMEEHISTRGLMGKVDGILMDVGVSSPQLDESDRGFSFMRDGPLDMRMNQSAGITAYDYLLSIHEHELTRVIRDYGEERYAGRIAKAIIQARSDHQLKNSTLCLANIIKGAGFKFEKQKHPATRTFQAIRTVINQEIEELEKGLEAGLQCLRIGGRLAVIGFQGLEHRVVKAFIRQHKGKEGSINLLDKVSVGYWERKQNRRARSAYLRIMERK